MIPRVPSNDQQAAPLEANPLNNTFYPHQANVTTNLTIFRPPVIPPGQAANIEAKPSVSSQPIQFNLTNPLQASVLSPPPLLSFTTTSLTPIPSSDSSINKFTSPLPPFSDGFLPHQKRSSMEMEDDLTKKEAPPTKQQLSETKLFKQFGSLHIDNEQLNKEDKIEVENAEDSDTEDVTLDSNVLDDAKCRNVRREFENYVYLLFKGKDSRSPNPLPQQSGTSAILDRMLRDEREKLSKAVILWSPPLKDSFQVAEDSDDEEFVYTDHKDFLKRPTDQDDSIIITEISDSEDAGPASSMEATPLADSDDVMAIE